MSFASGFDTLWLVLSMHIAAYQILIFCIFLGAGLFGEKIDTFYGSIDVEEPVLLELIQSPAFQRLRLIHQYGVSYYTTHREEYNRYDHSIGVFAILRSKGASLEEQIAGLLHDVSHTAFSHVGDWVFGKEHQEDDYQTSNHRFYLAASGLEKVLNKYSFTVEQILPKLRHFKMLEQPLPNLSADRIDYNIQGAYFQKFITYEEAIELFQDFIFTEERWVTTKKELAAKIMSFSLFMTENCWGSAVNHMASRWLADAILHGIKINLFSWHDFFFGTDQGIWDELTTTPDPFIKDRMLKLMSPQDYFYLVVPAEANFFLKFRCRGIDPWVRENGVIVQLTSIHEELSRALQQTKQHSLQGWPLKIETSADSHTLE